MQCFIHPINLSIFLAIYFSLAMQWKRSHSLYKQYLFIWPSQINDGI